MKCKVFFKSRVGANGFSTRKVTSGEIFFGESTVLKYADETDGIKTFTEIEAAGDLVVVKRTGDVSSILEFKESHLSKSEYVTDFGVFSVKIFTRSLSVSVTEKLLNISAAYLLDTEGESSECEFAVSAKDFTD